MLTGWKTLIFGAAVTLAGFLQAFNWASVIPNNPTVVGYVTTGIGVVIMVLRMLTTTPATKSS